jgi:hypothetical protein
MLGNWRWLNKDGLIPAHTICPFKESCGLADGCHHKGHNHEIPFSCAAARGFDMVARDKLERKLKNEQDSAQKQ